MYTQSEKHIPLRAEASIHRALDNWPLGYGCPRATFQQDQRIMTGDAENALFLKGELEQMQLYQD